jgi:hypothetical protein
VTANSAATASRTKRVHSRRNKIEILCSIVFLSILEISTTSRRWFMPSPVVSATAAMETTSVGAASKTRVPARREASDIAAVIKAAERTGARS